MLNRLVLTFAAAVATLSSGCATFDSLTPKGAYTDINKGVWVAKSSSFLGIRFASQEVLFCFADNKTKPICTRAGGDVDAATIKGSADKANKSATGD